MGVIVVGVIVGVGVRVAVGVCIGVSVGIAVGKYRGSLQSYPLFPHAAASYPLAAFNLHEYSQQSPPSQLHPAVLYPR